MLGWAMTVTIQRVGLLDLSSMTEWTNAVTSDPCVYRESKSERIDDEVRPVSRANL
jgi:hypothetical protein